jgi:hypothetical protein
MAMPSSLLASVITQQERVPFMTRRRRVDHLLCAWTWRSCQCLLFMCKCEGYGRIVLFMFIILFMLTVVTKQILEFAHSFP